MEKLNALWEALNLMLKIYWCVAVPFTIVFLIQLIWIYFRKKSSAFSDDWFSLKNMVVFFMASSWTGIAVFSKGVSSGISLLISIAMGLVVMVLISLFVKALNRQN